MIDNNNIEIFSSNNPFLFDDITDNNIGVSFDAELANTGDIVCITSLYDELIRRFGSYENAKKIYDFARNAIVGGNYSSNYPIENPPYLDFTIYLEQTIIDEGILSPYAEKWVPGKKYYVGNTVYYSIDGSDNNIKTYTLISGTESEDTEIPFSVYEANSWDPRYHSEGNKYYIRSTYYRGYYDNDTKLTYFDTFRNGSLILEHWQEKIVTNINNSITYNSISGTTRSQLENVIRKRSDMDISGNTLPFILHYIIQNNKRHLVEDETETFYMCGNMNMTYDFDSGKVVSDILESVTFYSSDSVPESGVSLTEVDKPIIITSNKKAYTSGIEYPIGDYDMIQFVYYSSATLEKEVGGNNWVRKNNTGVKYVEQRPIIIQTSDFTIEAEDGSGVELTLTYIDVNPNTQNEKDDNNIDVINSMMSDTNYSKVSVDKNQLGDDYFLSAVTFKDESLIGVQNVAENINVDIERGIAESYQKHNMLGEICTLQDLENYKNGRYLE